MICLIKNQTKRKMKNEKKRKKFFNFWNYARPFVCSLDCSCANGRREAFGAKRKNFGFAALNTRFFALTGVHMNVYILTDWLGLVPVAVCMMFGIIVVVQVIKRKSLLKADYDIALLGIYYAVVIFFYLIFEMIPINYRPVPIDGRMEASYPSSTTLLVISVMPTLVFQAGRRLKKKSAKRIISGAAIIYSAFMIMGRLVSGVHWLTDILGGLLLGGGLFYVYKGIVLMLKKEKK